MVYEAQQLPLRRRVALKILRPEALESHDVVERFEREARLASSLDHPQAVRIYTCGEHTGGLPYLAMEYLEGENLKSHLGKRGRLSEKEVLEILTQTLAPLEEAHGKGIVHRDLKPENLFLCRMGGRKRVVKVLDFGIAKTFGGEWANSMSKAITRRDMLCGTPHYMAPEQVLSAHQITPAADVYALGCIVYEMLSGQPPFVAESPLQVVRMHVDAPVPPLPAELGPSKLAQVLEKALRKNPSDRFEDAAAFARALRQLPSVPTPPWEAGSVERGASVELRSRPARLTWDEGARRRLAGEAPPPPRAGALRRLAEVEAVRRSARWVMLALVAVASSAATALYVAPTRTLAQADGLLGESPGRRVLSNEDQSVTCEDADGVLCGALMGPEEGSPPPAPPQAPLGGGLSPQSALLGGPLAPF